MILKNHFETAPFLLPSAGDEPQHGVDAVGTRLPRRRLPVQLLAAGLGQAVILPGAAVGLGLVGRDIAAVFQLFQDRVERALLHLEGVVRAALQLRDHLVAVQVLPLEQGEDE